MRYAGSLNQWDMLPQEKLIKTVLRYLAQRALTIYKCLCKARVLGLPP